MKKIYSDIATKFKFIALILIIGCCHQSTELTEHKNVESLAKKKFKSNYEILKNESGNFILCYKKEEKKSQPHTSVEYFVYNVKEEKSIYEEKLFDAEIKWLDENDIEIRINPEIISGDDAAAIFILNVLTKEKRKSNFIN